MGELIDDEDDVDDRFAVSGLADDGVGVLPGDDAVERPAAQ